MSKSRRTIRSCLFKKDRIYLAEAPLSSPSLLLSLSLSLSLSLFLSHVHPYKRASTNTLSLPLSLSLSPFARLHSTFWLIERDFGLSTASVREAQTQQNCFSSSPSFWAKNWGQTWKRERERQWLRFSLPEGFLLTKPCFRLKSCMKLNDPFEWAQVLSLNRNQNKTYFWRDEWRARFCCFWRCYFFLSRNVILSVINMGNNGIDSKIRLCSEVARVFAVDYGPSSINKISKIPLPPYCGQQCSWTLTPANIMEVSSRSSDDRNRK